MPLHLRIQTTAFDSFTEVDIEAAACARFVYKAGYGHPSQLSFVCYAPQHTFPLGIRNFIQFWDDAANGPDGNPQSSSNPLFEGFIEDVQPAESNLVAITAYDPTYESTRSVTILNLAYAQGIIPATPPSEQSGSYPRLVFNSTIDNDDDFAFCEAFGYTVGQLMETVLDWCYHPLYWINAAPGDGTSAGNDTAYEASELAATGLNYQPQEKEVFESESPRSAIDRLLRYAPYHRLFWYPGSRKWRVWAITDAPTTTLTLNTHDATPQVLSLDINRSLDGRYTSVHFYGPEVANYTLAQLDDTSLTDISPFEILESVSGHDAYGMNTFQITDPDLRNVARLLPTPYLVQIGQFSYVYTRSCTLSCYFEETNAGPAGWRCVTGWVLDGHNGIISTGTNNLYRYNSNPDPGQLHYEVPTNVKFEYGSMSNPIQVRVPATGYEGTAYTVANLQNTLKLYDEMLAIGYEYNNPVTSVDRLAQFEALARYELDLRKDIIYTGGAVLDGCRYEFAALNYRINIAGQDGSGSTTTTGWESIGAFLTDVEIDFDEMLTTLTFSGDQMELVGMDVEEMKKRLKIRALVQIQWGFASTTTTIRGRRISDPVGGFSQMWNVHETTNTVQGGFAYVDPMSGSVDFGSGSAGPSRNAYATDWNSVDPYSALSGYLPFGSWMGDTGGGGYN